MRSPAIVRGALLVLAAALAGPVVAAVPRPEPAAATAPSGPARAAAGAVRAFYATYVEHPPAGLPAGGDLERLRPFLGRRLQELIDAALEFQKKWMEKHPGGDEKPPFVDGDYFSSLFEGPRGFEVLGAAEEADGTFTVRVRFWRDRRTAAWEDRVVVVREGDRYVLDDVLYSGAGEFNPPGRLSDRLKEREE